MKYAAANAAVFVCRSRGKHFVPFLVRSFSLLVFALPLVVALGKLLTPVCLYTKQYNLVPAKDGDDLFGWESNRGPG